MASGRFWIVHSLGIWNVRVWRPSVMVRGVLLEAHPQRSAVSRQSESGIRQVINESGVLLGWGVARETDRFHDGIKQGQILFMPDVVQAEQAVVHHDKNFPANKGDLSPVFIKLVIEDQGGLLSNHLWFPIADLGLWELLEAHL